MGIQQELGLPRPFEITAHEAVINMVLTGAMLTKEGDRLFRPLGLTDAQFNILMLLKHQAEGNKINQTQLGQMLLVNRSNVTGLVDRMEQAGWVERVAERGDRRVKMVQLTSAGRRLLDKAEKVYLQRVDELMKDLNLAEMRQLCKLLERVRANLTVANSES